MNWQDTERKLRTLYPGTDSARLITEIQRAIAEFAKEAPPPSISADKQRFDHSHAALITYANSIAADDEPTLASLLAFLDEFELTDRTNVVHILPFYPWDTDRGFSVMDYRRIEDGYGSWDDIARLARRTELMFDFVANHASIDNPLIQNALIERHLPANDPRRADYAPYKDFCIAYDRTGGPTDEQIRQLSRPRPSHVLAPYVAFERDGTLQARLGQAAEFSDDAEILGEGMVWATFSRPQNEDGSEDTRQVDLNFSNPAVLVEVVRILLFYRRMGATLIRLDAIGYLWKKLGSSSLHEPETHQILELIYSLLAEATRETITIAEVNEPQASSFTYLGAPDSPEADWVYQFTHFPLALHCLLTGDATEYRKWLPSTFPANGRQFITTLGTHDGIGMKPVRGILSEEEIDDLCAHLIDHCGGRPNHASLPGGKKIVYEVCTTPWAAINGDQDGDFQLLLDRYLAVISLSFLVRGLPAIYINGLIGAENYLPEDGLDENRSVNREVFDKQQLFASLRDSDHQHFKVLTAVKDLLRQRSQHDAFSQNAPSPELLDVASKSVLAVHLPSPTGADLIQLVNLGNSPEQVSIPPSATTVLRGDPAKLSSPSHYNLAPYETAWLASPQGAAPCRCR